jgi:hypothetical protein
MIRHESGNDQFDQERSLTLVADCQKICQPFSRLGAGCFHTHGLGQADPIRRWIPEVEQIEGGGTGIGADVGQFEFQDGILTVRQNDRRYIEPLEHELPRSGQK